MEYVNCDLCGSTEYDVLWDKTERDKENTLNGIVFRDDTQNIIHGRNVLCRCCGLVYLNPRMNTSELFHFYQIDYRKIYKQNNSCRSEREHAENAIDFLGKQGITKVGRLLDIGCNTGKLLKLLHESGHCEPHEIHGVELNKEHCEQAHRVLMQQGKLINISNCSIEDYTPETPFDTIAIMNTLEHVISPTNVLNKVYEILNMNGILLISVPNLANRTLLKPMDVFLSNCHLYNFCDVTITALLHKCGFRVIAKDIYVESIGEKLYVAGRKTAEKQKVQLRLSQDGFGIIKNFITAAESVYNMKIEIQKMGFR